MAQSLPTSVDRAECDLVGRTVNDGELGVEVPAPGSQMIMSALRLDGSSDSFAVAVDSDGTQVISGEGNDPIIPFYDSAAELPAGAAASTEGEDVDLIELFGPAFQETGECSDNFYRHIHGGEHDQHQWKINPTSFPDYINQSAAIERIREGGAHMAQGDTDCSGQLNADLSIRYMGTTGFRAEYDANAAEGNRCHADDGQNTVDFGNLVGASATTCTRIVEFSELSESDLRFNNDPSEEKFFTDNTRPNSCNGRDDLEGIATHERGHTFGLGDIDSWDHPKMTMRSSTLPGCSLELRSLGRGDILGLNDLY